MPRLRSASRQLLLPFAALLLVGVLACRDAPAGDPPTVESSSLRFAFSDELRFADLRFEQSRLRTADPDDRIRMIAGWSYVEQDDQGPYTWSDSEQAEVSVFVAHPRPFDMIVHGGSFQPAGAEALEVAVEVNGTSIGSFTASPDTSQFRKSIPVDVLRRGDNRITFNFSHALVPRDTRTGTLDSRRLALRLYSLELRGLDDAGVPSSEDDMVSVPAGSTATWIAAVYPGDVLEVAHAVGRGATGHLRWRSEDGLDGELTFGSGDQGLRTHRFEQETLIEIEAAAFPNSGFLASWFGDEGDASLRLRGGLRAGDGDVAAPTQATAQGTTAADAPSTPSAGTGRPPDVLIYLVDTLRADHLGLYGYDRPTSPRLDAFAEDAVTFTEARAQTSWTRTSVVSMFTGLYPPSHGVQARDDGLPDEVVTLAERLKAAGYRTVGMTTNGNVSPEFGVDQGFDIYQHVRESHQRLEVHRLADDVERWVATWLGGEDLDDPDRPPFLLYAHATDPHAPYTPREPFRSQFAADADPTLGQLETMRSIIAGRVDAGEAEARQIIDLYDAEIAFTDHYFGALLDRLKNLGLYDDMVIVFVSDHGEEFLDHGDWEHGRTLYDEQLLIPLVIKFPDSLGAGLRLAGPANHVDVMPTLLEAIGLPAEIGIDGRSLMPSVRAASARPGAAHLASGARQLAYLEIEGIRQRSLVDQRLRLKVIDNLLGPDSLFDLEADPDEQADLAETRSLYTAHLRQTLRRLTLQLEADQHEAEAVEMDPETRRQLEALGYIQ